MNKNRLKILLAFVAALILSGCGAAAEKAGGDRVAAAPSPDKQSPARQPEVATTPAAAANVAADTTPAAAVAGARQDGSGAGGSRGRGAMPPAAMPTPAIGSGGNDLFLFTQARAAVNADSELRAANLILEVKEGVLTLSGTVASAAHKSKAEQLVRESGVKTVKNQLRVSAGG